MAPMSTPASNPALGEVRTAILTMAQRLAQAPDVPEEGVADLKNAVDDIRIRLWGVLMAGDSSDYQGFVGRFRMRRAAECCRGITEDVTAGKIQADSLESKMLLAAARQLANRLDPVMAAGRTSTVPPRTV
jgi:hypothetical protein